MKTLQKAFVLTALLPILANAQQSDFWQQVNGPFGATVEHVVVNPVNDDICIYIESEGIFRSTDGGASWMPAANAGLPGSTPNVLAINASGALFAGTKTGIFRSTDNGETWQQVYAGTIRTRQVNSIIINLQNGEIFAGASFVSDATLLRSSDNGDSWAEFTAGLSDVWTLHALAQNASTGALFAATQRGGVLTSTDRGESWSPVDTTLKKWNITTLVAHTNGDLFAGADSLRKYAIFRYTPGQGKWMKALAPASQVLALAQSPSGVLYAGTNGTSEGIYISQDSGRTWQQSSNGLFNLQIKALSFDSKDRIYSGTQCAGVFVSSDKGVNWTGINEGLKFSTVLSLAVNPITGSLFAGTDCAGIYRSKDRGESWTHVGLPGSLIRNFIATTNGDLFTSAGYRSSDDGETWQRFSYTGFSSFAIHPNGDMYGGGGYIQVCGFNICDFGDIFRSSDGGSSWQRVADKLDDYVVALAISPSGRVFAGTSEGIFRNFAEFWHKISPNNTRSLFVDPATNAVFAGTSGGIWRSLNEGENWDYVHASNFVWSFAKDLDGNILAGTQTEGVLESSDNGATWVSLSSGLQKMDVRALAVDPNTGQLFAGLANGSVFKSMNPTTAVQEITGVLPNDFALEQNYPNPFNPSTVIRFQLPVSSEVKLTIYNLTGQLVRTLVDAQKSAGRHEVVWDGRSDAGERLPSGVYLYRIEAGDFRAVRRLAMVE